MSLERTRLTPASISELLRRHYGIEVAQVEKLPLGTANCFRVSDGVHDYFLKEFQSDFQEEEVTREALLLQFLAKKDFPVAAFYPTADGGFTVTHCGHVLCLQSYVHGTSYGYDDLPPRLLPKVGEMLGRLHTALKDYPLPLDMGEEWVNGFSGEHTAGQYARLLETARTRTTDPNTPALLADLAYKQELALRCEQYKKYYDGITYCPTHGDFQGCQILFDRDEIAAVVDFSSARSLPVVWEIMRSFVQSSKTCRETAVIDVDGLCDYVSHYQIHAPLTKADLCAMPYVYLFQLARSKYGYPQYLNSDSEDKEGLLRFAAWRTQICRELEEKAEYISKALTGE